MTSTRIDHVALAVASVDAFVERLARIADMRLIRYGLAGKERRRMAMVGDGTGMKFELIEYPDATTPRLLHVAFRSDDVAARIGRAGVDGIELLRGPISLEAAEATSALFKDEEGAEWQFIQYAPTSPDVREWTGDADEGAA
jgi:hypothetical protein